MKKYKSSDLTHKRAEVLKEAKANGVIIQQLETNGEIRQEFVIVTRKVMFQCVDSSTMTDGRNGNTIELKVWDATQPNLKY